MKTSFGARAALVAITAVLGAGAVLQGAPSAQASAQISPRVPVQVQRQQIVDRINAERSRVGARPLVYDVRIQGVAQNWTNGMVERRGESAFNPHVAAQVRGAAGCTRYSEMGVDLDHPDPQRALDGNGAVDQLLRDDYLRGQLLDRNLTNIGIGVGAYINRSEMGSVQGTGTYFFMDLGGACSPVGPDFTVGRDGVRFYGGQPVKGAILGAYAWAGELRGVLNAPVAGEFGPLRAGGFGQHFQGGSIYWSPASGSHMVRGPLRDAYAAAGWEGGVLGYPTGPEFGPLKDGGYGQHFQGGSIYWTAEHGAHVVRGAIRAKFDATGWEGGVLGYPTSNEFAVKGGVVQRFSGGNVYWSQSTGAVVVESYYLDRYARYGYEGGRLGFPTAGVQKSYHGDFTTFQNGSIYFQYGRGDLAVFEPIRKTWVGLGAEAGALGYPTGNEFAVPGGVRQNFERGSLSFVNGQVVRS